MPSKPAQLSRVCLNILLHVELEFQTERAAANQNDSCWLLCPRSNNPPASASSCSAIAFTWLSANVLLPRQVAAAMSSAPARDRHVSYTCGEGRSTAHNAEAIRPGCAMPATAATNSS